MNKNLLKIAAIIVGLAGGYLYWYFYACTNGCAITSAWWRSALIGGLMGYLLLDMAMDLLQKKQESSS